MQVLETIDIRGGRRIDLCQGDLSDLARNEWFDAVVVSAFNREYTPTTRSLIGALHRRGVSVAELAVNKELDYTQGYGTWLSMPVHASDPGIGFARILCFEPGHIGRPPEVVGHFFRALTPIIAERADIRTIAMPVLSSGEVGYSIETMLPPMLDAAVNVLARGLPLDRVAIVVRDERAAAIASPIFAAVRAMTDDYDVFVSYAHEDTSVRERFVEALLEERPKTRIFIDRFEIDDGAAWQRKIFESLDRCRRVVSLLSPDYVTSPVCLEEFNIAWMRSRDTKQEILRPLFVRSADLSTYMRSRLYLDCREFDADKLRNAAQRVAASLDEGT